MSAGSIVCASAGGLRPVVIELDSIPERTCPSPQPDVAATTAVPRREGGEGRRIRHGVVTVPSDTPGGLANFMFRGEGLPLGKNARIDPKGGASLRALLSTKSACTTSEETRERCVGLTSVELHLVYAESNCN